MGPSLAVVTGTSSGIGLAVAQELLQRGWSIVGISRRPAPITHANYTQMCLDLGDTATLLAAVDEQVGTRVSDPAVSRLGLVNNAALVGLLGTVEHMDPNELLRVYAVNVVAPAALMGWMLRRRHGAAAMRIVDVSTGAAVRALPGMAAYASSKAALRMLGMVLGTELELPQPDGSPRRDVSLLSFEPGMVDTAMQTDVRTRDPEVLPIVGWFKAAEQEGKLVSPALPARAIADYLESDGQPSFREERLT